MKILNFGLPAVLAGCILTIVTFIMWLKARSFEKNGVSCTARVQEVRQGSVQLHSGRSTKTYGLIVHYLANGVPYTRELPVGREEYLKGADRDITICYKKSNPKKIVCGDPADSLNAVKLFLYAGLGLIAVGLLLMAVKALV